MQLYVYPGNFGSFEDVLFVCVWRLTGMMEDVRDRTRILFRYTAASFLHYLW